MGQTIDTLISIDTFQRVIKVWSCTYLIIFLMIVEVWSCILYFYGGQSLIMYILCFDNRQSVIMYFIFQRSLKFDHVSYILIVVEVWSCYLIFFYGCWGFDHVFYILMVVEVWSCILLFGHNCWSLDNLIISCVFCTHLSNKTCVFFFSPYKP
jgi:hypothetical protein